MSTKVCDPKIIIIRQNNWNLLSWNFLRLIYFESLCWSQLNCVLFHSFFYIREYFIIPDCLINQFKTFNARWLRILLAKNVRTFYKKCLHATLARLKLFDRVLQNTPIPKHCNKLLSSKLAARKCVTTRSQSSMRDNCHEGLCFVWDISFNLFTQNKMRDVLKW